nr:hypothetical protein [Tanacetum cinerariifolium]
MSDKGKCILQEPEPVKKTKKKDQDQLERDAEVSLKIQADLDKDARTERERHEEASKAVLAEMYNEVQAQIDADHELATRLTNKKQEKYTVKERSKLIAEFFDRRKKQLAKERDEAIRSKPPIKTQIRNFMMTYLKHTGRFTCAQLKSMSFEDIQKLYTREQKWVDAFVPIGSEEDEKRVGSRKKRAVGLSSKQKSPKKQKVNNQESKDSDKELRKCLKVVPDDDKAIDYKTLDVKSTIINFLDRQDVLDLHKIIVERFPANDLEENQQDWKLLSWKLYETCRVHTLMMDDSLVSINMFVEKRLKKSKVFGYIILVIMKLRLKKLDFHQYNNRKHSMNNPKLLGFDIVPAIRALRVRRLCDYNRHPYIACNSVVMIGCVVCVTATVPHAPMKYDLER